MLTNQHVVCYISHIHVHIVALVQPRHTAVSPLLASGESDHEPGREQVKVANHSVFDPFALDTEILSHVLHVAVVITSVYNVMHFAALFGRFP